MKTIVAAGSTALVLLLGATGTAAKAAPPVAGAIIGGSSLLDNGRQAQLERWLGAGEFNLNNVYTLRPGDTSANFHRAADGKGATFTLIEVANTAGQTFLVGGYNPQGWSSTDGWHETERDFQRTAFLFNFTTPAVYRQVLSGFILPSQGQRQTFNDILFGPVFGSGPDLLVNDDLTKALSWQLSYGDPANEGKSIIDGSLGGQAVSVNAMEIFAIAPVPEPASAAMLLAGVGVLGAGGRWRRRKHGISVS
ncbi:PEP_CTERM-anchored TLD domain-containing protein [Massilia sp. LXY-6]|uniref:PEP_CTERM-anchored TLD domain-containing protein n=1 Tax=Massilia sp. LXY-6 TaxID=3379823 RepID=UPI003EE3D2DB